jgi:hypothetical protein
MDVGRRLWGFLATSVAISVISAKATGITLAAPTTTISTPTSIHTDHGRRIEKRRGSGVVESGADMPSGYRSRLGA